MPLVTEMVHPNSMDFPNQRKCVMLRDVRQLSWRKIAEQCSTLRGKDHHPSARQCREVYKAFSRKDGRRRYKYAQCGRKPWKVSPEVESFLVRKLLALRQRCICTSTTLQRELLREKHVQLATCTIRRILQKKGYHWLPRSQKPKFSKEDKRRRLAFAEEVLAMAPGEYRKSFAMAMDGVVLALPPDDPVDRENFCHVGETHMWRKRAEAAKPELSGADMYNKQLPYARAVPLWGGIGNEGFGLVMYHNWKKVDQGEWSAAVNQGKLVAACKSASGRARGPWTVLCDNESFLQAKATRAAHAKVSVVLWHIPPRSPDLNPVEKFWGWLRKRLRAMDLADLKSKRRPIQRTALKARVRGLVASQKAKSVAKNYIFGLRNVCEEVRRKRGAASRG